MSIGNVVKDVALASGQIFDHTQLVRSEIERFVDQFEKNERHKEFDGILRASHSLVEAIETPVEALFEAGKMKKLIEDIDKLTERINTLKESKYKQEHEAYLEEITNKQKHYLDVCREEAQRRMRQSAQRHSQ